MNEAERQKILDALAQGDVPEINLPASELDEKIVDTALESPHGRRWLRSLDGLTTGLAARLVTYEEDFRAARRDRSLMRVVVSASLEALIQHRQAITGSSAASVFWERLAGNPENLQRVAVEIAGGSERTSAENTLYLLVLDPLDPYRLGEERRIAIARAGLSSGDASVRSLAAEYLFDHRPEVLAGAFHVLVHDDDQRIRGLAWSAGIRADTGVAIDQANRILGDDTSPLDVRRSALAAIGTNFNTADVVDLLAEYVLAPERDLALDAANLLYRLHRHPVIATAAAKSPHQEVREIGEFLLDPYRGSPAAGGSRPGDPTQSDVFAEMIRQTEERMLDDIPDDPDTP